MKKTIAMLGCALLLGACSQVEKEVQVQPVTAQPLNHAEIIGIPIDMESDDSYLYFSDFYGDSLIVAYDLKTGGMQRFGRKGEGPADIMPPTTLSRKGDRLYAFSMPLCRMGYFERVGDGYQYTPLFTNTQALHPVPLTHDEFLSTGYFEEGRYAVINLQGDIVRYVADYPDFYEEERHYPSDIRAMFHQARLAASQEQQKVASVGNYVMDIIDFSTPDYTYKRIKLHDYTYIYEKGTMTYVQIPDAQEEGAFGVAASDKYIYVLYSTNTDEEDKPKQNHEIWVYDWDGQLVRKLLPSMDLSEISVQHDKLLLGIANAQDEPTLVKIEL